MSQLRAPLFERIARSLRLGRWRYFSGCESPPVSRRSFMLTFWVDDIADDLEGAMR